MKTTSYKLPETRPKNKCFLFSRWLAPLTLAVLGPIHHTWGTQIVQDAFLLLAFLGTLAFSSTLALSASRSSGSLWVFVILIRLFWGINTPSFSDDHYRYLHEGQASLQELSMPYQQAPAHFTEDEAFPWAKHVNHPKVSAAYLPGLQWFFMLPASLATVGVSAFHSLRVLLILFDIGLILLLLYTGRQSSSQNLTPLAWYAFHPLPLLEVYGNSHADIIGVFFLFAVMVNHERTPFKNALAIAISAHIKPFTLLFGLWACQRKKVFYFLLCIILFLVIGLPHFLKGASLFNGLSMYIKHWNAFGLVYEMFISILSGFGFQDAGLWSRIAHLAFFLWLVLFSFLSKDTGPSVAKFYG